MEDNTKKVTFGMAFKPYKKPLITSASIIAFSLVLWLPWYLTFHASIDQAKLNTFFSGLLAVGSVLAALAIIAAFAQVREAKKQLRDNRTWNTMSFALTFLPSMEMLFRLEHELEKTFVRISSRTDPMSQDDIKKLYEPTHAPTHLTLKAFLNALEAYCVAINSGLAHEDTAKRIYGYKLQRHYIELQPYIGHQRAICHDNRIFSELEQVWKKWGQEIVAEPPKYGRDE
jgi:hypothetical protein